MKHLIEALSRLAKLFSEFAAEIVADIFGNLNPLSMLMDGAYSTSNLVSNEDDKGMNENELHVSDDEEETLMSCIRDFEESFWIPRLQSNEDEESERTSSSARDAAGKQSILCKNPEGDCRTSVSIVCQQDETFRSRDPASAAGGDSIDIKVGPFMLHLFEKQLYTDVTFYSNDNEVPISAHRAVLASKCGFFQDLLFGVQRNEVVGLEMQVQISNVSFSAFRSIVKYFYTDDIEFSDEYTVLAIHAAAQSFRIQPLIEQCHSYIRSMELTENNVCYALQVCNTIPVEGLKSRCISFIRQNAFQVICSKDFEKCSFSTVLEICELQDLNLSSEVELLEAVLRWINVQPMEIDKEQTRSLLECIRFLTFTPRDFIEVIQRHTDLLDPEEGLKILMYLNFPTPESLVALPEWCHRSQTSSSQVDDEGFQTDLQNVGGRIKIPLKASYKPQDMSELTSVLEMTCIKGFHRINTIKFLLEDFSAQKNSTTTTLEIKTQVLPKGGSCLHFRKTIDSKEVLYELERALFVCRGQTVRLEVKIKCCDSCKFLQFDTSENDVGNDHFQCSVASRPRQGNLFFICEVEYGPQNLKHNRKWKKKNQEKN